MTIFGREPVAITSTVRLVVYALIAFEIVQWTELQIGTALAALEGVLLLVARQNVASPATLREAGTSLHEVKSAARSDVSARLQLVGPDAQDVKDRARA